MTVHQALIVDELLEMIENESLEMIQDESLKMIEDESLDIIVDETLKLDEYFAFGRHLEELHVTWTQLEKKRTRLRTYTNITQDNILSSWRRRHQYNVRPSQRRPRWRH
ncbi:hypothetical protein Tco_1219768 [Tanacetum coccineum]